jgi:hypothetical protein
MGNKIYIRYQIGDGGFTFSEAVTITALIIKILSGTLCTTLKTML